jgi:hypothetical protein
MTDEHLAELWAKGESLSSIGEALGESRSAIAGRIHRARKRGSEEVQDRPSVPTTPTDPSSLRQL